MHLNSALIQTSTTVFRWRFCNHLNSFCEVVTARADLLHKLFLSEDTLNEADSVATSDRLVCSVILDIVLPIQYMTIATFLLHGLILPLLSLCGRYNSTRILTHSIFIVVFIIKDFDILSLNRRHHISLIVHRRYLTKHPPHIVLPAPSTLTVLCYLLLPLVIELLKCCETVTALSLGLLILKEQTVARVVSMDVTEKNRGGT